MRRAMGIAGGFYVLIAAAAVVAADDRLTFVEVPGQMELSGQLIARPVQPQAWADHDVDPGQAAVRDNAARAAIAAYVLVDYVWQTDEYVIEVPAGQTETQVARALMATGNFEYVHPNWTVYPLECPNDARFSSQWQHNANRLQSCDGWDIHTGTPDVSVGICDTGIRTSHEDFQLHRLEGYNAVDQRWESAGGNIIDIHGHGTATTGCAAANGNNGVGVSGVGWNLSHRMLRVSNSAGGGSSLATLNHAARTAIENGDRVASVSYSGVNNATNRATATYIKSIGGLMVWAAGNDGAFLNWGNRDADDIIVAGGTDEGDNLAGFSARGPSVDVVAPAVNVYTTSNGSDSSYGGTSGTSFACPLTAGLCALIWSAAPTLSPDEVEGFLKGGVDDLGAPGPDDTFGHGRINVFGSLSITTPPALQFIYPNGTPEFVHPAGGTAMRVEVLADNLNPVPGTGMLHYNDGSGWNAVAMSEVSDNVYDAIFPSTLCGAQVLFYVSAEASDGLVYTDPGLAPDVAYDTVSAASIDIVIHDNFQADMGWVAQNAGATTGDFDRGVPVNDPNWDYDPVSDSDGSGRCYLTQNQLGNTDVDDGAVRLTSPMIDMTAGNITIEYDYFLRLTEPGADQIITRIRSEEGGPWTVIATHNTDGGLSWRHHTITQEDLNAAGVTLTPTMQVRFRVNDDDPQSIVEAGIDAFRVSSLSCGACDPCDANCDGIVNAFDIEPFLNLLFGGGQGCDTCTGDANGDGHVDAFDIEPFLACLFP